MLKYLFTAEFIDGSVIQQTQADVSSLDPKRSAFFDVLEKEKTVALKKFTLSAENSYSVDLTDGHFEVNGLPFRLHEEPLNDLKIIFFRQHTHKFNQHTHKFNLAFEEQSHDIVYRMGWQTTKEGKNIQHIIEFD